jgi:hypothetical protein
MSEEEADVPEAADENSEEIEKPEEILTPADQEDSTRK